MSASKRGKLLYLDNREALLAMLDEVRSLAADGLAGGIALIVVRNGLAGTYVGRSVYVALNNTTADRDRLAFGAELLLHQLVMDAEEENDAAACGDDEPPPRGA